MRRKRIFTRASEWQATLVGRKYTGRRMAIPTNPTHQPMRMNPASDDTTKTSCRPNCNSETTRSICSRASWWATETTRPWIKRWQGCTSPRWARCYLKSKKSTPTKSKRSWNSSENSIECSSPLVSLNKASTFLAAILSSPSIRLFRWSHIFRSKEERGRRTPGTLFSPMTRNDAWRCKKTRRSTTTPSMLSSKWPSTKSPKRRSTAWIRSNTVPAIKR